MKSNYFFLYNWNYILLVGFIFFICKNTNTVAQLPLTSIAEYNVSQTMNINSSRYKTAELYQFGYITYYEYLNISNISQGCFLCYNPINHSNTGVRLDLPPNLYVTDFMQIMSNDQIVFCGWVNDDESGITIRKGVIGWVDCLSSVTQANLYYMIIEDVKYFEAIDAYYVTDLGLVSIVAIAKEVQGTNQDGILHTFYTSPLQQQTWSYNLYKVEAGEHFWNIVGTQDYEVFVGADNNGLCLRKENYLSLSNPVELNNVYTYAVPDGEPSTKTKSTLLGNRIIRAQNDIVVGSQTFASSLMEARFRVINTSNMDMINSQKFYIPTKLDMYGLCYTLTNGMLSVLISSEPNYITNHSSVVLMKPYNTLLYTANYLYHPQYHFKSIDCFRHFFTNIVQIVLGSFDTFFITWLEADSGLLLENDCYRVANNRVIPMENVATTMHVDPLYDIGTNVTLQYYMLDRLPENIDEFCREDYN